MLRAPLFPAQYLPPLLPRRHMVSNVREGHATRQRARGALLRCCTVELRTRGAVPAWSSPSAILKRGSGEPRNAAVFPCLPLRSSVQSILRELEVASEI